MTNQHLNQAAQDAHVTEEIAKDKARAMAVVLGAPQDFRPDFPAWLDRNWPIYTAFKDYASNVFEVGHRRYSSKTIIEAIRYHSTVHEVGGSFKINNNVTPDLSRLFDLLNPSMAGMFEFRTNAKHSTRPAQVNPVQVESAPVQKPRKPRAGL